jgi:hypothetical protein
VLETETRLAAAILGLDPGIGVLHVDTAYRDSLACDLMEAVRPDVDAFVLNWLKREPLPRSNFFEQRDGNCRLMANFTATLSQTAPTWARLVAPVAEWFAREISSLSGKRQYNPPARLTQRNKREVRGGNPLPGVISSFSPKRLCRDCGREIAYRASRCRSCVKEILSAHIKDAARAGRIAAHSPEAQVKRAATQKSNARARYDWKPSDQPTWLTTDFYSKEVMPKLESVSASLIAQQLRVSYSYADDIRKGRKPHPRHWQMLAKLLKMT